MATSAASFSTPTAPAESAVKSINALRRGLDVLYALENSSAATLAELHRQTSIPKATLLRILKTLQQAGRIGYNDAEARYMPAPAMGESGAGPERRARLAALAAPLRQQLQLRVPWPCDLAVRDGRAMLILDAHRPVNGLAVNYRVLGFRPPMLVSSLGRCYMAFCPESERREILALLARSPYAVDRVAQRPDSVRRLVANARALGYAVRDPSPTSPDSPDRFGAFSVPVFEDARIIGCISCAWLPAVAGERDIVAAYLAHLQDTAHAIENRLRQSGWRYLAP